MVAKLHDDLFINAKGNKTHQNIETGCFIFYFASRGETGYLKISDVVKGCCRAEILSLFKGSFWGSGCRTFYHTATVIENLYCKFPFIVLGTNIFMVDFC